MQEQKQAQEPSLETVQSWLQQARHIAVLTGAGVSAESGVPTFREAQTGYWAQFRPEDMATEQGFRAHPQRVWDWYQHRRDLLTGAQPNAGHAALARYQQLHPGRLTLITQNVDGLHQRAGSAGVLCLHGDIFTTRWLDTPRPCCEAGAVDDGGRPPRCSHCGNLRRPGVVWFGESLPSSTLEAAQQAASACQVFLVVGTAGAVYPAAGLAQIARHAGARVAIINPAPSALDDVAHVRLRGTAATLLPALLHAD
jgi:NAD-dependent deacetylase